MPARAITRRSTVAGTATTGSAPIYVDSDDNRLKFIPAGSGSTEVILQEAPGVNSAEVVTATNVIDAAESGKTFFLNSSTEFVSTLPAPALGLQFTFIVAAAPSGASYTIVTNGSANIIKGNQNSVAGDAGDFGTADDTITFVDGQSVAGDKVEVYSDGTSWFAYAISKVAAGITFTQASA